jgi:hypothetical protein
MPRPGLCRCEAGGPAGRLQNLPALVRAFFADPDLRYITAAT